MRYGGITGKYFSGLLGSRAEPALSGLSLKYIKTLWSGWKRALRRKAHTVIILSLVTRLKCDQVKESWAETIRSIANYPTTYIPGHGTTRQQTSCQGIPESIGTFSYTLLTSETEWRKPSQSQSALDWSRSNPIQSAPQWSPDLFIKVRHGASQETKVSKTRINKQKKRWSNLSRHWKKFLGQDSPRAIFYDGTVEPPNLQSSLAYCPNFRTKNCTIPFDFEVAIKLRF